MGQGLAVGMLLAVGGEEMVGVALFTMTLVEVVSRRICRRSLNRSARALNLRTAHLLIFVNTHIAPQLQRTSG